jgi:predicted phage-related endonuclease
MRSKNIGASEVACLFGMERPYQHSKWTLWQVKSGNLSEEDAGMRLGERPRWGLLLESAIMEANAEDAGWRAWRRAGYFQHPTVEGFGCTPDFFALDEPHGTPIAQCETKNVDFLIFRDEWTEKEPPEHILMQIQAQMANTGFDEVHATALVGGNTACRKVVERRPKIIEAIESAVEEFWYSIETNNPPPIDGKDGTARAVKNLYRPDNGKTLDVGDDRDFLTLVGELAARRKIANEHRKEILEIENQIYCRIQNAEIVKSNGVVILTAKEIMRKGYTVEEEPVRKLHIPKIR